MAFLAGVSSSEESKYQRYYEYDTGYKSVPPQYISLAERLYLTEYIQISVVIFFENLRTKLFGSIFVIRRFHFSGWSFIIRR